MVALLRVGVELGNTPAEFSVLGGPFLDFQRESSWPNACWHARHRETHRLRLSDYLIGEASQGVDPDDRKKSRGGL